MCAGGAPDAGVFAKHSRRPIRGGFHPNADPVVFARASLDHRLISFHPPGEALHSPVTPDSIRSHFVILNAVISLMPGSIKTEPPAQHEPELREFAE